MNLFEKNVIRAELLEGLKGRAGSADGKTTTVTQSGKDPEGRAVNNTAIYDKQ